MPDQVQDKKGNPINEGDTVYTKARGGKREGEVEEIIMTQEDAKTSSKENVKNPPKVVFTDQHGHKVAHNPGTLENLDA
ncbi:1266da5c-8735-4406-8b5c-562f5489a98a [Sclerotinia trifoliorum]|uniref:1266da5c-8735-4406-8b5c-562f5489a98a n=1 Tax=Sclerotinia trifoliorum TaxID=28548 RepID=A0A8H2ZND4_9HELO|nr:1266da5c-8735-4406-8b5c-562f5489a98a [Sclerotinia trifoliorum]